MVEKIETDLRYVYSLAFFEDFEVDSCSEQFGRILTVLVPVQFEFVQTRSIHFEQLHNRYTSK